MDKNTTFEVLLSIAQSAPATFVLAFVAYRLDQRIASLTDRIDSSLGKLIDAALTNRNG